MWKIQLFDFAGNSVTMYEFEANNFPSVCVKQI